MNPVKSALDVIQTLDRYTASPHFLGYFEATGPRSRTAEAVDLFLRASSAMGAQGSLLLSITTNEVRAPAWTTQVRAALDRLGAAGWLAPVGAPLGEGFRVEPLAAADPGLVRDLCALCLEGFLFGHAFFGWEEERLVIYPHDEGGFGAFAVRGAAGEAEALAFLREAEAAGFVVDVRR